jgi:hypothetical protein
MSRNGVDIAALAIMLVGLAACVSPEELRAQDDADCRGFGFQLQRESLARRYYAPPPGWYGPGWWGPGWPLGSVW